MTWEALILIVLGWSFLGAITLLEFISVLCDNDQKGALGQAKGWEFVNPLYIYKHNRRLNWFGAILVALLYSLLCPVGALCYWIYKIIYTLCTVGRK